MTVFILGFYGTVLGLAWKRISAYTLNPLLPLFALFLGGVLAPLGVLISFSLFQSTTPVLRWLVFSPLVEEFWKGLAILILSQFSRCTSKTLASLGLLIGLAFASLENFLAVVSHGLSSPFSHIFYLWIRTLGPLTMHALLGMGMGWLWPIHRTTFQRLKWLGHWLVASYLHALYNFIVLQR